MLLRTARNVAAVCALLIPGSGYSASNAMQEFLRRTDGDIVYTSKLAKKYIDDTSLDCRLIIGVDRDIPYELMLRGAMEMLNWDVKKGQKKSLLVLSGNGPRIYGHLHVFDPKTGALAIRSLVLAMDGPGKPAFQRILEPRSFPELCGGTIIPLR